MNVTAPFVLKRDILLTPCAELSDDMRARISFDEGDYTLSHRNGRALAQVIDGETAALLMLFREPRTIVEAVVENSRALGKDPRAWFDELLPHLGRFVERHVLVPVGAEEVKEIRPQFDSGATIAGWEVVRCVSLVVDSEVYQLRNGGDVSRSGAGAPMAALKIARLDQMKSVFENEIAILRHLDGAGITPRLLDAGTHDDRSYCITEWAPGVDAGVAAAQRRHDRPALIELCASIAAAYATLHARGVLHADLHPRNVVVLSSSEFLGVPRGSTDRPLLRGTPRNPEEPRGTGVMLLDFGYSRFADRPPRIGRGGIHSFFEPEYLAAPGRHASAAGEQYALAAMLYLLIADHHYLEFRLERKEMLRQIAEDAPLPFAKRGVPPWPEVERILFRALEKDPSRRHSSIAEMAALLAEARDAAVRESLETPVSAEGQALLESTLRSFARGGEMFAARYTAAPKATINYGSAGAAVGLLRIAETRGDPALLALADVWRSRAYALIDAEGAFYDETGDLRRANVGDVTPYHTESGIHAAGAMIAAAMGDTKSQQRAVTAFLRSSNRPCAQLDLTLGRSGSLLASAMLLAIGDALPEAAALRAFGAKTMRAIWNELDSHPPLEALPKGTYLGMAHGWAGYFYAAMRWCSASGDALPPRLTERLDEFMAFQSLRGRGAYWRRIVDSDSMVSGWCNGSAGLVFLFTLAHRIFHDDRWLRLAELCAWNNWDEPRILRNLCCGSAGRAYALLHLYKYTGAKEWLSRARQMANHAASVSAPTRRPHSLWKGELGVAVLIADLASPENARMPFFE